jgi:hypothetical protein
MSNGNRPELDPAYIISVGNQNDPTLGDMVSYLKDAHDIAVYAKGLNDLDGQSFRAAIRETVIAGKDLFFP